MPKERILVVDDEEDILELVRYNLVKEGYNVTCELTGEDALKKARSETFDLIVLDLMLPGINGLEVTKKLKGNQKAEDIPIVMLTAKGEEADIVTGLELGADDYITKPFSPRELVARVKVVLRRVQGGVRQPGMIMVSDLEIDVNGYQVHRAGQPIQLSRTEFNILTTLAQHPGQTFTRAQLLNRLHGYAQTGYDRSIDAHIKNLRRKLEPDPANPRYVLTVYGVGYKFNDQS